ncbi:MAG TPA: DUF371 domain-containing protein [Candidatus Bathyarchaeia archaeon]|nr:DUF371 domain-containing protein [Candidatus Bathyarchaeia archaeon]
MIAVEEFFARGHANITAKHATTLEITKEVNLSKNGDCIIAVGATKGLTELSKTFRILCADDNAKIILELNAAGFVEIVQGRGSSSLALSHHEDIVARKSSYVTDRTLIIAADKAARDINRRLVRALRSPNTSVRIRLTVYNSITGLECPSQSVPSPEQSLV